MDSTKAKEVEAVWLDIIKRGKRSDQLLEVAKKRGNTSSPKYFEPNNLEETGSISCAEACCLYELVTINRPLIVFDIGTWFGTSACIMAMAQKDAGITPCVYTCDRNMCYVGHAEYGDGVHCYNGQSTDFLRRLLDKANAGFAFVDATLRKDDFKLISAMVLGKIALHDYYNGEKGSRNAKLLERRGWVVVDKPAGTCMAIMEKR